MTSGLTMSVIFDSRQATDADLAVINAFAGLLKLGAVYSDLSGSNQKGHGSENTQAWRSGRQADGKDHLSLGPIWLSRSNLYWKPEHPPESTEMRSAASAASDLPVSCCSLCMRKAFSVVCKDMSSLNCTQVCDGRTRSRPGADLLLPSQNVQ